MPNWRTFYGKEIELNKMSHQHLSNITYYSRLVLGVEPHKAILNELTYRFGGITLPYHPLISFNYEIDALIAKGHTTGEPNADIFNENGIWIGKIKY